MNKLVKPRPTAWNVVPITMAKPVGIKERLTIFKATVPIANVSASALNIDKSVPGINWNKSTPTSIIPIPKIKDIFKVFIIRFLFPAPKTLNFENFIH